MKRVRRQALRAATADSHSRLDSLIGGFDTRTDYRLYLLFAEAFWSSVCEFSARDRLQHANWLAPSDMLEHVKADCRDMDLAPTGFKRQSVVRMKGDEWIGAQYVLEGSALGAKVLFKRAKELGLSDAFGARHLAAQARSSSGRWVSFLDDLERLEPFDLNAAVAGAERTFGVAIKCAEACDAAEVLATLSDLGTGETQG